MVWKSNNYLKLKKNWLLGSRLKIQTLCTKTTEIRELQARRICNWKFKTGHNNVRRKIMKTRSIVQRLAGNLAECQVHTLRLFVASFNINRDATRKKFKSLRCWPYASHSARWQFTEIKIHSSRKKTFFDYWKLFKKL